MSTLDFIEITTKIGCPCNCLKFCPQEILINNYTGEKTLSLNNFKLVLSSIPPNMEIAFAGFL
jgi:hypothetical protein